MKHSLLILPFVIASAAAHADVVSIDTQPAAFERTVAPRDDTSTTTQAPTNTPLMKTESVNSTAARAPRSAPPPTPVPEPGLPALLAIGGVFFLIRAIRRKQH